MHVWQNETVDQAALREVKEEVGIELKSIIKMNDLYFDAANSSTPMPFYLAEVDADEIQTYAQSLDDTEDIKVDELAKK